MTTIDINSSSPQISIQMSRQEREKLRLINKRKRIANEEIPSWMALIAGASAGISVDVGLFPLDTLKTRLQASQGFFKAGGFRGLYSGLSAGFLGSAPGAALFFFSYEWCKPFMHNHILKSDKNLNANPMTHMLAASCAETAACLVRVPTEVVKQRMQTGLYQRLSVALSDIYARHKLRGFYVGYSTTVAREIPFSFIQFPLWERFKIYYSQYLLNGDEVQPWQGACCGSVSGGIAAAVTTPLDVIKTRLMLQKDTHGVAYKGFRDCCKRLYQENGYAIFYSGIAPRVTWIFLGGFFFFGAYEKSKALLKETSYYQAEEEEEW